MKSSNKMIKQSEDEPTTPGATSDFSESASLLMTQEKEPFPPLSPSKRTTKERMNRLSFRVNMSPDLIGALIPHRLRVSHEHWN